MDCKWCGYKDDGQLAWTDRLATADKILRDLYSEVLADTKTMADARKRNLSIVAQLLTLSSWANQATLALIDLYRDDDGL